VSRTGNRAQAARLRAREARLALMVERNATPSPVGTAGSRPNGQPRVDADDSCSAARSWTIGAVAGYSAW